MSNTIRANDIIWTKSGDPVIVDKSNDTTGEVYLDNSYSRIRTSTKNGIKNGLTIPEREAYNSALSKVENTDKKQEIKELFDKIKSLKENNADIRLIKYLQNELQFRMIRENFVPADYGIDPVTITT